MKKCRKCNQTQPLDEFYKNKAKLDGKTSICKRCQRDLQRNRKPAKPGWIYVMSNPAWPDHFKVGKSNLSIENRLNSFQTSSPFRDYKMIFSRYVLDTYKSERLVAEQFNGHYEWYNEKLPDLIHFIKSLS